jgi:prepilin peptidase CpaA
MDFPLLVDRLALTAFAALLVWAAWSDLRDYIIPNRISLAIATLYPAHVMAMGDVQVIPGALVVATIVFAVGFAFFALRIAGGGDVKLITVAALWAGHPQIIDFLFVTAMAGGILAAFLAIRAWRENADYAPDGSLILRLSAIRETKVPYGAAIAGGGLYIVAGSLA